MFQVHLTCLHFSSLCLLHFQLYKKVTFTRVKCYMCTKFCVTSILLQCKLRHLVPVSMATIPSVLHLTVQKCTSTSLRLQTLPWSGLFNSSLFTHITGLIIWYYCGEMCSSVVVGSRKIVVGLLRAPRLVIIEVPAGPLDTILGDGADLLQLRNHWISILECFVVLFVGKTQKLQ